MVESSTELQLKLSDYILEGMKLTRPAHNYLVTEGQEVFACTIGAACYAKDRAAALEWADDIDFATVAWDLFPELSHVVRGPGKGLECAQGEELQLLNLITSLNDTFGWRRDRIARFVKQLGY